MPSIVQSVLSENRFPQSKAETNNHHTQKHIIRVLIWHSQTNMLCGSICTLFSVHVYTLLVGHIQHVYSNVVIYIVS